MTRFGGNGAPGSDYYLVEFFHPSALAQLLRLDLLKGRITRRPPAGLW